MDGQYKIQDIKCSAKVTIKNTKIHLIIIMKKLIAQNKTNKDFPFLLRVKKKIKSLIAVHIHIIDT